MAMTGTFSSFARAFNDRDISDISCSLRSEITRSSAHELEVVDDEKGEAVLLFQPSRAGPELENGEGGRIIDIERGAVELAGGPVRALSSPPP